MAEVLGKMEDVQEFQLRMDKMKIVFNTNFGMDVLTGIPILKEILMNG